MLLIEFFNSSEGDSYADIKATKKVSETKRPQTTKRTNMVAETTRKTKVVEDQWSGPDNAWHNGGSDQWYDGNDQWHGQASGNMIEDFAVANMVATESSEFSDILTARELIGLATRDPQNEKHKYFEFLKHLRSKHGEDYSTRVHQKAAKLARTKA